MPRTGRRPGDSGTRDAILEAARTAFADRGYRAATIRAIAGAAEVDPALVHHYFGTKRELFVEAMSLPLDPSAAVDRVVAGNGDEVGERLIRMFLSVWDVPTARDRLLGLVRSVVSDEHAARMLREFLLDHVLLPVTRAVAPDRADLRAALLASQLVGLAISRHALMIEPLSSAPAADLVAALGPTLQRYLTGPIAGAA